jgi:hypothetical protein
MVGEWIDSVRTKAQDLGLSWTEMLPMLHELLGRHTGSRDAPVEPTTETVKVTTTGRRGRPRKDERVLTRVRALKEGGKSWEQLRLICNLEFEQNLTADAYRKLAKSRE